MFEICVWNHSQVVYSGTISSPSEINWASLIYRLLKEYSKDGDPQLSVGFRPCGGEWQNVEVNSVIAAMV